MAWHLKKEQFQKPGTRKKPVSKPNTQSKMIFDLKLKIEPISKTGTQSKANLQMLGTRRKSNLEAWHSK